MARPRLIEVDEVDRRIVVFAGECELRCPKNWTVWRRKGPVYPGDMPAPAAGVAEVMSCMARESRGARQKVCAGCATDC